MVSLRHAMITAQPEIVIHMAAQALVRQSYLEPVENYAVNVLGTVHLLEAVRLSPGIKAVIVVTSDKCYENREWLWSYRENEALGGYDPYSSSKACAELVSSAYRTSFFPAEKYSKHQVALASARAGNVIGGGDWARDRLIPDAIDALIRGNPIKLRHPRSIRPWQHVLEPLSGYLTLAEHLYISGPSFAEAWNFGPDDRDEWPVEQVVSTLCLKWGTGKYIIDYSNHPHEAATLKLDCAKAKNRLNWYPHWDLSTALDKVVEWYQAYLNQEDMAAVCLKQITAYMAAP